MRAYRDRPKEKGTFEKPSTRQKMTKLRGKKREQRVRLTSEETLKRNAERRKRFKM